MSLINNIHVEIENLTTLLSKPAGIRLFPGPLEQEYQQDYIFKYYYAIRLTLWFGYVLFVFGSIFIYLFFPEWQLPFSISNFMVSPILLLLLFLCHFKTDLRQEQLIVLLFSLTILAGLAIIAALAPMPFKDLVYQGMILPSLFVTTLAHLQFRYSIFIPIMIMISTNISYHFSGFLELHQYYRFWVNNYLLLGGSSLCLLASYFNEGYYRRQFLLWKLIQLKNQLLEKLSYFDELTGIPNRRNFDEYFDNEWGRAKRDNHPLALIFIDFDYFKQYNDYYGHLAGDKALYYIAQALMSTARRPGDFVARYGGDEFIMILSNTSLKPAIEIAKKIQAAIKKLNMAHEHSAISNCITVTMGVAALKWGIESTPFLLLKQADIALNDGKKHGRNQIYSFEEGEIKRV